MTLNVPAYDYAPISTVDAVLVEAFHRAGLNPMPMDENSIRSAKYSVIHELSQMPFSSTKLWLRQRNIQEFKSGQTNYVLSPEVVDIQDLVLTLPHYIPNTGTASSNVPVQSGTSAANCFVAAPNAGCVQTEPNGAIQYDYGASATPTDQFVYYAFIQSLEDRVYTLAFEYSFSDPADDIWIESFRFAPQRFVPNEKKGFVLERAKMARAWRMREIGGATLAIQTIELANQPGTDNSSLSGQSNLGDVFIYGISQTTYQTFPYKRMKGRPNQYFLYLENPPVLQFYPCPDVGGNAMPYTHFSYISDLLPRTPETLPDNINMPPTFFDSFVAGVALRLAIKFNSSKVEVLQAQKNEAAMKAAMSNVSLVSIDFSGRVGRF